MSTAASVSHAIIVILLPIIIVSVSHVAFGIAATIASVAHVVSAVVVMPILIGSHAVVAEVVGAVSPAIAAYIGCATHI